MRVEVQYSQRTTEKIRGSISGVFEAEGQAIDSWSVRTLARGAAEETIPRVLLSFVTEGGGGVGWIDEKAVLGRLLGVLRQQMDSLDYRVTAVIGGPGREPVRYELPVGTEPDYDLAYDLLGTDYEDNPPAGRRLWFCGRWVDEAGFFDWDLSDCDLASDDLASDDLALEVQLPDYHRAESEKASITVDVGADSGSSDSIGEYLASAGLTIDDWELREHGSRPVIQWLGLPDLPSIPPVVWVVFGFWLERAAGDSVDTINHAVAAKLKTAISLMLAGSDVKANLRVGSSTGEVVEYELPSSPEADDALDAWLLELGKDVPPGRRVWAGRLGWTTDHQVVSKTGKPYSRRKHKKH